MTFKTQIMALIVVLGVMGGLILFGYFILWIVKTRSQKEKEARKLRLVKSK